MGLDSTFKGEQTLIGEGTILHSHRDSLRHLIDRDSLRQLIDRDSLRQLIDRDSLRQLIETPFAISFN